MAEVIPFPDRQARFYAAVRAEAARRGATPDELEHEWPGEVNPA